MPGTWRVTRSFAPALAPSSTTGDMNDMSLFVELKRRNVFRVGIAYVVTSWLILQVADIVLDNTPAPDWIMQVIML